MLIFKLWLYSKPKYGRYQYQGRIYTKSNQFIEVEKSLYTIRLALRVLCIALTIIHCAILREAIYMSALRSMFHVVICEFLVLPMYYFSLSDILHQSHETFDNKNRYSR